MGEALMRKLLSFSLLAALAMLGSTGRADTLHLKNGSIIKGKVTSFSDDRFVVLLDTGSGKYISRAQIYVGDVASIEFDSGAVASMDTTGSSETGPRTKPDEAAPDDTSGKTKSGSGAENPPRDENPPAVSTPEPDKTQPDKPTPTDTSNTDAAKAKAGSQVVTANVDVIAKRDWTSTGLIVKRGDQIRITATGTVTLDPLSGRTSGPEGIELADARKLMLDRPTGALIGVIGADNDDFIFIGAQTEFTAARDGLLFLSVNEGALSDNLGAYKTEIEVQKKRGAGR
jgi:hypothetical protein